MTGAMYAAIAGLRTHMSNLNVIGHNVANVNTTAYKSQRSVFRTAIYTQMSGGSNGSTTAGGVNPSQVGYGANLATISKDMSTGSYAPGLPTDCMIDGDGFFLVGGKDVAGVIRPDDPDTLTALTLTRTGDFEIKADGYLCDGVGSCVYGFLCVGKDSAGDPVFSDQLVPIRVPRTDTAGNVLYPVTGGDADTAARLTDATPPAEGEDVPEEYEMIKYDSFTIDKKTGVISATLKDSDMNVIIGVIAIGNVTNPNGVTADSNTYYSCGPGAGDLTITLMGGFEKEIKIGTNDGVITEGQAHYASVTQRQEGEGLYVNGSLYNGGDEEGAENPSDRFLLGSAGTTALVTGGLELSKTDLATEISNMITTQRGYQANTRIITVTDSMLEELVNMKR